MIPFRNGAVLRHKIPIREEKVGSDRIHGQARRTQKKVHMPGPFCSRLIGRYRALVLANARSVVQGDVGTPAGLAPKLLRSATGSSYRKRRYGTRAGLAPKLLRCATKLPIPARRHPKS